LAIVNWIHSVVNPLSYFFWRIVTRVDKDFRPKDCSSAKLNYCARGLRAARKVIRVTAREKNHQILLFFTHLAPPVPLKIAFLNNIYRCCARVIRMTNYLYVFFWTAQQTKFLPKQINQEIRPVSPASPLGACVRGIAATSCGLSRWLSRGDLCTPTSIRTPL